MGAGPMCERLLPLAWELVPAFSSYSRLHSVTLHWHTQNGQALVRSGIHTSKIVVRALCQKFSDDGFHFSPMGLGLDGEHLWVVPDYLFFDRKIRSAAPD